MLENEGVHVENIEDEHIEKVIEYVAEGRLAKEAIPDLLRKIAERPTDKLEEILEEMGLRVVSESEVVDVVNKVIEENIEKLKSKPGKAFNIVMSEAMRILRGRVDGSLVADIVKKKLSELNIM
jgi:glutamyl-tRNA(Gln) amidotransferase subunit E